MSKVKKICNIPIQIMALALVLIRIIFSYTYPTIAMGPAGFEPATSSARGWHHTKLDNGPRIARCLDAIRIICLLMCWIDCLGTALHFRELEKAASPKFFLLSLVYPFHFAALCVINICFPNQHLSLSKSVQIMVG